MLERECCWPRHCLGWVQPIRRHSGWIRLPFFSPLSFPLDLLRFPFSSCCRRVRSAWRGGGAPSMRLPLPLPSLPLQFPKSFGSPRTTAPHLFHDGKIVLPGTTPLCRATRSSSYQLQRYFYLSSHAPTAPGHLF